MARILFLLLLFTAFAISCQRTDKNEPAGTVNQSTVYPPAEGFNSEASDAKAIAVADSVMQAMGGYEAWQNTPVISWNFFGRRTHTWDKHNGRDRIEIPEQNMMIEFDINSKKGTVMQDGEEVTNPDSLSKYLDNAYKMWVNDSYWLVMPYKLKDTGVTLKYMGIDTTMAGIPSHKLKLTFDNVGVTSNNMYHVYVDTTDHLVRQWKYFPEADMEEPGFVLPWNDYKRYGNIMLSGNRGQNTLSDIKVMEKWPDRG